MKTRRNPKMLPSLKTSVVGSVLFAAMMLLVMPRVALAETEYFLIAPVAFPKTPYNGQTGAAGVEAVRAQFPRTQLERYYEGYWGPFWGVMSYGKYIADVKVADIVEMPWPFNSPIGGSDFPSENYRMTTLAGQGDLALYPNEGIIDSSFHLWRYGVDGEVGNDFLSLSSVWTPGERYNDTNGIAGFQYMEEWWDAGNLDKSRVNKFIDESVDVNGQFDEYGELFADYDKSETWTANVELVVYDGYLDKGSLSTNATEALYGSPGDGFLGGPLPSGNITGKPATRFIRVNELMLNIPFHFSTDPVVQPSGNTTGDREWTQYVADEPGNLNEQNKGTGLNDAEVNAIAMDNIFTYSYNEFTRIPDGTFYRTVEGVEYGATTIVEVSVDVYQAYEVEGGFNVENGEVNANGDGIFTARDPFEDFLVRWEPWWDSRGLVAQPSGGWVPVTHLYMTNNYPGDVAALIARSSNNQTYDAAEPISEDYGSYKIQAKHPGGSSVLYFDYPDAYVPSTEYLLDTLFGNADWTGGSFSDNRLQGFTANVMTSKIYDLSNLYANNENGGWDVDSSANIYGQMNIWYSKVFGTEIGGGGNLYPEENGGNRWKNFQWELYEFDTSTDIGGGLIKPDDILGFSTAYFLRIHDDEFGAGFAGGNFVQWPTIGLNANLISASFNGGVVHNLSYDSPREFRDLPAALHNIGGDYRLGEITGPRSSGERQARYAVGGVGSAGAQGYDSGANDPASPSGPDQYAAMGGPLFTRGYGTEGYDAADVTHMELLTWNTSGDQSSSDRVYSPIQNRLFIDITTRLTRDINLDGLIDQGYSPPLGFHNYLTDGNGGDDGSADGSIITRTSFSGHSAEYWEGYPFSRERGIEDTVRLLDAALFYDDFTEGVGKIDYVVPLYSRSGYGVGMWAGPSGINFNMYTEDYKGLTEIWGHSDPNPSSGGRAKHEAFHDLWGSQDLYDYDVWNGLAESFPIANFDVMSGGPYTMTPITKIFVGSQVESAPFTEPRDLRTILVPGEETVLQLYPVNLIQNDNQYYYYGRFLDENNTPAGSTAGNIFENYEGAHLVGEGYYFYYDNGYMINAYDADFSDGTSNSYSVGGFGDNLFTQDPDDPTNYVFNTQEGATSSFSTAMQGLQILHQDYFPVGESEPLQQRSGSHFRFEMVEADGLGRMRDGIVQQGDTGAVWGKVNKTFNYESLPKSRWWDGDDTGIEIVDIELPTLSSPPTEEELEAPALVTFLWKEQLLPTLSFINPPGGLSFDGEYVVEAASWDRYGATTVHFYREGDDEDYDGSTYLGSSEKTASGAADIRFSDTGLNGLADGGYYYYAFLEPGSSDKGTEQMYFAMPILRVGRLGTVVVTPGANAFSNLTSPSTELSSSQYFTLSCNAAGGDGEATFTVTGSRTGLEDGFVTAGPGGHYTTQNDFTGSYTFNIMTGSANFGLEDQFRVYTTGLTAYSQAILVENGEVVQEDPNSVALVLSPLSGDTTEGGTTATFAVKLNTRPTADVVVTIDNPDDSEITLDKETLIFTPDLDNDVAYWKLQTITITGVDDDLSDGDQSVTLNFSASSADTEYDGIVTPPISVTNRDDEDFGLIIEPDQTIVAESDNLLAVGATLQVKLRSLPTRDVTVFLKTSDSSEAGIINNSGNQLVFTPDNWNSFQEIYVSGNNDTELDGDQSFFVTFNLDSDDNNYNLIETNFSMTCVDDDIASIIVGDVSNDLYESGISGTFSIRLSQQPSDNVKVSLKSDNEDVAILDVQQLVFGPSNFSTPQVITVYPMENNDPPSNPTTGSELTTISFDPLVSEGDANYNTLQPPPFAVEVFDNDDPGFTVSKITNNTDENGRTATFHVFLQSVPTGNVVVSVTSSDITEGTVLPSQLIFTPSNWNGRQQVTVTGVDEQLTDGNIPYTVILSIDATQTLDANYIARDPRDVELLNIDNESAQVVIEPSSRLTDELRGRASFKAYLAKEPTTETTLVSESSDLGEARFSSGNSQVVFDSTDYFIPKTIFINGVTDLVDDGNISFKVSSLLTGDPNYAALTPADIFMINLDKELPAIIVSSVTGDTSESGAKATFSVKLLKSLPENGRVYLDLTASSDEITLDQTQLEFNENNYSSPQIVTITGQDDDEFDGNVPVYVSIDVNSASNSDYLEVRTPDVRLFNLDDDQPGLNIVGIDFTTSEDGDTASFDVSLFTKPTANLVKVNFSVSDDSEATLVGSPMIFLASTWQTPQTVTITGWEGNDTTDADGDVPYTLSISTDTSDVDYSALTIPDIELVNLDNDSPKVNIYEVGSSNVFSFENLETTEAGGNVSFSVNLQVADNLILTLTASDSSEGNIIVDGSMASNVAYVYFDASGNGYQDKTVVIEGVDDTAVDGDVLYTVDITVNENTPLDSDYLFEVFENPEITNKDDDQAEVIFSGNVDLNALAISGNTSESGNQVSFQIALNSIPTDQVFISMSVQGSDEVEIIEPADKNLTFFNKTPQTVTLQGVDDEIDDDTQAVTISFNLNSDDSSYRDLPDLDSFTVYNEDDDDKAGYTVQVSETSVVEGKAVTVSVNLHSEPVSNVQMVFTYDSNDDITSLLEGTSSLTFTPSDWEDTQTTILQTIDNGQKQGDVDFDLEVNTNTSDAKYSALSQKDIGIQIRDDDNPGIDIVEVSGNVDESGRGVLLGIRLGSEPTQSDGQILLDIESADTGEIEIVDSTLEFNQSNWSARQYVKIRGVADSIDDGDQSVVITVSGNANSAYDDTDYTTFPSENVIIDNLNVDAAGLVFYEFDPDIDEAGGFNTFRVGLLAEPTNGAIIEVEFQGFDANNLNSSANLEISETTLTFDSTDYDSGKIVTLKSTDNVNISADEIIPIVVQATETNGVTSNYVAGVTETLNFNLIDVEAPALLVTSDTTVTSESGQRAKVSISLRTMPTESVTVSLSVDRNTEAGLTASTLTFSKANYDTPQVVEVVGANDSILDGPIEYVLRVEAFDGGYDGQVVTVDMVNMDNDSPGVRLIEPDEASTAEWVSETSILLELSYSPSEDVSVNVSVSDNTEAEPVSETVNFELLPSGIYTANVMISGLDDTASDSHQNYRVIFSDLISDDANFNGLAVPEVDMINYDDETSGIQIALTTSASGNLITKEYNWGGASSIDSLSAADLSKLSTNTFTVSLLSSPAFGNVVINVSTSDALEAVVKSGEQLLFTSANYNVGQVVEIVGRDDEEADGDTEYSINLSIDESTGDLFYRNFPDRGVSAVNEEAALTVTDSPNIDGTNAQVYDLLEEDGLLTLVASEGRPDYTWTLLSSPAGSSLDVDGSGIFQTTITGANQQQLSFQVGDVPGVYQISVSDTQISKETEVYEYYLRGSPMVQMDLITRPTVNSLRIVFEDTAIVDRTNYVVEWSADGEEPWTNLNVLTDTPQVYSSKPGLGKVQRGAASDSVSQYYLDVSFAQGGNPDSVGYFRITAEDTVGQKTTAVPATAIQQTAQYTPIDAEDNATDKILSGGGGGGGGGGCLLK